MNPRKQSELPSKLKKSQAEKMEEALKQDKLAEILKRFNALNEEGGSDSDDDDESEDSSSWDSSSSS